MVTEQLKKIKLQQNFLKNFLDNVNKKIGPVIIGLESTQQVIIDQTMLQLLTIQF